MNNVLYKEIEDRYSHILTKLDWYLELQLFLKEYFYEYDKNREGKPPSWKETRTLFVQLVAKMLNEETLAIGDAGFDMDAERLPIDTVVIHHTSTFPDTHLRYIEALTLIRLYTKQYASRESLYYGKPLWSGHFYKGSQTFHAYHYLIREDGSFVQTLKDSYIGWQAGNWNVNCRSISIAFVDELEYTLPSGKAIKTAKGIISKYGNCRVIGHNEVNPKTSCPGKEFSQGIKWKKLLLA